MIAQHPGRQRIAATFSLELCQETFSQSLAPDPRRIEALQKFQRLHDRIVRQARLQRHIGRALSKESAIVEVADKLSQRVEYRLSEIIEYHLLHEMLLERGLA